MEPVIAQLAPHSAHTHVKDERGVAPDHEFLIPGEGEMDYVRYLTAMQRAGYDGPHRGRDQSHGAAPSGLRRPRGGQPVLPGAGRARSTMRASPAKIGSRPA